MEITIIADKISKSFNNKQFIFKNISFEAKNGDIIAIRGPNGSGKSTLIRIIAKILSPTYGKISWIDANNNFDQENLHLYYGFVAPYYNLYEEFTPVELIKITAKIRNLKLDNSSINQLLHDYLLFEHRNKFIRNFSSGMKQRMKLLLSNIHNPIVLIYDEPTTNLDEIGVNLVTKIITDKAKNNGIVFLASNDEREINLCTKHIFVQNR